jgi:hypothetical protein
MGNMHRIRKLACLALLAGCGWQPDEADLVTPARPPAAAIVPMREATPLEDLLATLDTELRDALAGDVQGDAVGSLIRAEAVTDRLLEARQPFQWLHADQYNLAARLRQIQSQADRAVAALLSGQPHELVVQETELLHQQVLALRHTLAQGGGPPRQPVDRLIQALDTLRGAPAQPAQPAAPRPPPLTAPPPDTTQS